MTSYKVMYEIHYDDDMVTRATSLVTLHQHSVITEVLKDTIVDNIQQAMMTVTLPVSQEKHHYNVTLTSIMNHMLIRSEDITFWWRALFYGNDTLPLEKQNRATLSQLAVLPTDTFVVKLQTYITRQSAGSSAGP